MVLIAAIIAGAIAALIVVVVQLCKAPVGYEDAGGFHIVQRLKSSAVLRHKTPQPGAATSLKSAEAHS